MKNVLTFSSAVKASTSKAVVLMLFVLFFSGFTFAQVKSIVQFVYTSDLHYGIARGFRGQEKVPANVVNQTMIAQMNTLPTVTFPTDGGVNAGKKVGSIDYVLITGDITNRQQTGIQSATASWAQFSADYLKDGITLKNKKNQKINKKYLLKNNK